MYLGKVFVGIYAEILVCFLKDERTCEWGTDAARGLSLILILEAAWAQPSGHGTNFGQLPSLYVGKCAEFS